MERLTIFCLMGIMLATSLEANSQIANDYEKIRKMLADENIDGQFSWRFGDTTLENIAYEMLKDPNTKKTNRGIAKVCWRATNENYNSHKDSFFLSELFSRSVRIDSFFYNAHFIRNHFLRSDYQQSQVQFLAFYARKENIFHWSVFSPYYLSFLNVPGIEETLLFAKKNVRHLNALTDSKNLTLIDLDTVEINICLSRLGKMNDTLVVGQIEESSLQFKGSVHERLDYKKYISRLSMLRTPYAFDRIGVIIGDESIDKKERYIALAAFLAYVKNFPDRSTKWQDTFNMWTMVTYSNHHGKDYSTPAYLKMASEWYAINKDNIILDFDKY